MLVLIRIPEPMRTLQDLFNNVTSYNLPPALLLENPTAKKFEILLRDLGHSRPGGRAVNHFPVFCLNWQFRSENVLALFPAERFQPSTNRVIGCCQNRRGEQPCIFCAGFSYGQSPDGNPPWHLRCRQKRIKALELRLNGHAQDRQPSVGGNHSSQMCRSPRTRNNNPQAALGRGSGKVC